MNHLSQLRGFRRRYVKQYGKRLVWALDRFIAGQSRIGDQAVFDNAMFSWTQLLETHWQAIRTELDAVLVNPEQIPAFHQVSPDQARISKGDNWKTFVLYGFGTQIQSNTRRCPETVRILKKIPGLQNAWFSILAPGYHIPPHRGVTKGLLRCHLALMVPPQPERCRIRVGDQICHWQNGKCLVFDDTYEHEVWNDTDEQRVVLFLDIERPLRLAGRLVSAALLRAIQWTAYVKDARKNLTDWEQRVEAAALQAESFHLGAQFDENRSDRNKSP